MALVQTIGEALSVLGRMLKDGWRVFIGNWPMLFTLFFLGTAVRAGFLWLAIEISDFSSFLAMLILPFAPLSLLVALVLMLRVVAPALPELNASMASKDNRSQWRADLVVAVMVLVPFLAVYASQGMIKDDLTSFFYSATADEWGNEGFNADFSRVTFASDALMIGIVIAALVLRKVIAGFQLAKNSLPIAGFAGYLEALWLVTLASYFAWSVESVREWVTSRVAVQRLIGTVDDVIIALGPVGSAIRSVIDQVLGVISSMGALVIVPVAWIAVGATIYGSSLPGAKPLLTSEQMTQRIQRIPSPVRRVAAQVSEPVVNPFRNTVKAIGRVAAAGVIPMVLLCVVFASTSQLRVLATQGMRLLIGPKPDVFWVGFTPFIDVLAQSIYMTVMVSLLAASVNAVMATQRRQREEEEGTAAQATPSDHVVTDESRQ